jgi:hypothetical protein
MAASEDALERPRNGGVTRRGVRDDDEHGEPVLAT